MWNVNALGLGTVVMLALALPADGVALASHLTVFEARACIPLSMRPATWIAGELLEWREANRASSSAGGLIRSCFTPFRF